MKKHLSRSAIAALIMLAATPALCLIDINTASQSELESLPRVGPKTAEKIIQGRPYRSVSEITRVKGIGNKTLVKFKHLITVSKPGQEKKQKAPARVAEKKAAPKPIEVQVYSVEKYRTLKCHKCRNQFRVSSELRRGWCPYCIAKWALRGAPPPPGVDSSTPETSEGAPSPPKVDSSTPGTAKGAISWKDAAQYLGQKKIVEGTIVGTYLSVKSSGNLYMNFSQDYKTSLSVTIPKASVGKFRSDAASYYKGKKVIAKGLIEKDKRGYLRLVVPDPKNIKVVE